MYSICAILAAMEVKIFLPDTGWTAVPTWRVTPGLEEDAAPPPKPTPPQAPDRRLTRGDRVQLRSSGDPEGCLGDPEDGAAGEIFADDGPDDDQPYHVRSDDGHEYWYRERDLEFSSRI